MAPKNDDQVIPFTNINFDIELKQAEAKCMGSKRNNRNQKKKHRKGKSKYKGQIPWQPVKMELFKQSHAYPEDWTKEKGLEVLRQYGKKCSEEFHKRYPSIKKWFCEYDSLYILSFCAFYFLSYPEGTDPEAYKGKLDFYHHYLEIMQAFAVTQNRCFLPNPLRENAEKLKNEMKELGELMGGRQFDIPEGVTEEEIHEHILMWRMRGSTIAIRNWAYPDQIFRFTRELFCGTKLLFEQIHNIDPIKLIDLIRCICRKAEDRLNSHRQKVRTFFRMGNYKKIINTYNNIWPDTIPITEEQGQEMYEKVGKSVNIIKQMLIMHSDLRLSDIYTFSLDELSAMYGDESKKDSLRNIFDRWSLEFGSLNENATESFILDNPVLNKPFIKLGDDKYYSSILGIFSHLILDLMEGLVADDESLQKKYIDGRMKYVEDSVEKLLKANFPNGSVFRGSLWGDFKAGNIFENDFTVILDSFALIVECKGGKVSSPAKRGAPLRLKRTLHDLIVDPSTQAIRFIEHLVNNKGINHFKTRGKHFNVIDNTNVKYYVPISVTFQDMGFISSNMKEAIRAGVIDCQIDTLVPSLSLGALECVFDLLENEVNKIHYFLRRRELEHHLEYLGDEIDLLAFYLDNGFNIGETEYANIVIMLSGKSKELDPYFIGKSIGKTITKPNLQITDWWKDIINKISNTRPDRWTEVVFTLLNSTKEDQANFEWELKCLSSKVKLGRAEQKHNWIVFLSGPPQRRYFIAGFPYRLLSRNDRNQIMNDIFGSKEVESVLGAVCIGIDVDKNEYPYSVLGGVDISKIRKPIS